jgi:hypothetical protein
MKRRRALASLLGTAGVLAVPAMLRAQGGTPGQAPGPARGHAVLVEVWKSPTCGCCQDWITHLEANG